MKVAWTDEHGDWLRQTFTSRPDNVVVQWLTAPAGQSVNVRISLQKSAEWSMSSGMDWGSHAGIDATAPDRAAFAPVGIAAQSTSEGRRSQRRSAGLQRTAADLQVPFGSLRGQQRLRRGGSRGAQRRIGPDGWRHAGDRECVVRDAAHAHRIFPRLQRRQGGSRCGRRWKELTPDYAALLDRHRKVQSEMLNRVTVDFGGASQYGMSDGGTSGRSAVEAGFLARVAGEDLRNGTPLVHPQQRQVSRASRPRSTPPSTCKRRAPCRATCGKAWRPTSTGWRAWPRIAGPTPRTSSDFAAPRIPSFRTRISASSFYYTSSSGNRRFGPTGFPPEAGAAPVLGPLPGHRRRGISPQSRRAGI